MSGKVARNVCVRHLGRKQEDSLPGKGSSRDKTSLLLPDDEISVLCFRDQSHPCRSAVDREIAPEIIDRFLTFLYVPGEETLLKGINKLAPGHYLLVKDGKSKYGNTGTFSFQRPSRSPSFRDAEAESAELLAETVELHMIADVPVGVLLSGGVDSTAVLSFAAERTEQGDQQFHRRLLRIPALPTKDPMPGWRRKPSAAGITT